MPPIQPFNQPLQVFNWNHRAIQLPRTIILPRRDELATGYTALVNFLRILPTYCIELSAVLRVATTQIKAQK